MSIRRTICLWLPQLAIERNIYSIQQTSSAHARLLDEKAFALIKSDAKGVKIFAANDIAHSAGIKPLMRLSDARAICHHLTVKEHNPQADKMIVTRMAQWLERYSPSLQVYSRDTILIDITGCAHLFGGEALMLKDLQTRLARFGFTAKIGLADTIGAAYALARYHENAIAISTPGKLHQDLAFLPVRALRLANDQADALYGLGLKTIGQLFNIPRASLARRFTTAKNGEVILKRLDQALGRHSEPLRPQSQPAVLRFSEFPAEPCMHFEAIMAVFEKLLSQLLKELEKQQSGILNLYFICFYSDHGQIKTKARFAKPCRIEKHIKLLFTDQIRAIDPRFGFDGFILTSSETAKLSPQQNNLLQQNNKQTGNLPELIDRFVNRFGNQAVFQLHGLESHHPEKAQQQTTLLEKPQNWQALTPQSPRPITIFTRPETIQVIAEVPEGPPMRFRWRRVLRTVTRANGPERIAPEWWHDFSNEQRLRDYYQVEDTNGQRYWLFRIGRYNQTTANPPRWAIHGLFL